MLGTGKDAVCLKCHTPQSKGYAIATQMKSTIEALKASIEESSAVIANAEKAGMEHNPVGIVVVVEVRRQHRGFAADESDEQTGVVVAEAVGRANIRREGESTRKGRVVQQHLGRHAATGEPQLPAAYVRRPLAAEKRPIRISRSEIRCGGIRGKRRDGSRLSG